MNSPRPRLPPSPAPPIPSVPPRASTYRDGCCELQLTGEIDLATVDGMIESGLCCLNQGTVDRLVIALGAVTFLDASGLGALVTLRNAGREVGKTVELAASLRALVSRVLRITGLDTAFVAHSCPDSAHAFTRPAIAGQS